MSNRSLGLSRPVLGVAAYLLFCGFVACSDDEPAEAIATADGGGPDSPAPVEVDAAVPPIVDASDERDADVAPRCGADGFCLTVSPSSSSPAGQAVSLYDVWIDPDGRPWAVGYRADGMGVIAIYDGTTWKAEWTGRASLTAIAGVGRDEIWASGTTTALHGVRRNGTFEWTTVPFPDQARVSSVWAAGPNDAWACGSAGILHWTGSAWTASLSRGTSFYEYTTCSDIWGTDTGELWASMQHAKYDADEEYHIPSGYIARRPPGGAGDAGGGDAGDAGSAEQIDPSSTDGWLILTATRSREASYGSGFYAGAGVHRVVGLLGGRMAAMHSKLEGGNVVFGPFANVVDSKGALISGSYMRQIWGTPTEAWGVGPMGVYRFDGQSWALARTAIDGVPLAALGQPSGIFGDPTQIFVVGNNLALRRPQVKQ